MIWIFPIAAIFTLAGLLYYGEWRENQQLKWIFKPLTSLLFLMVGLVAGLDDTYSRILFLGLFLCFWGDVFLIPHSKQWFLAGLVSFLSGHIAYLVAFLMGESHGEAQFAGLQSENPIGALCLAPIILVVFSGVIFRWLQPKLAEMQTPVMIYVIVITIMVWGAWGVFYVSDETPFRYLVLLGAVSFYFSDLAVAIDRFVNPSFTNRLWGLPLYYLGQFLLAFSIYYS